MTYHEEQKRKRNRIQKIEDKGDVRICRYCECPNTSLDAKFCRNCGRKLQTVNRYKLG